MPRGPERLRRKRKGQYLTPDALAEQLMGWLAEDLADAGFPLDSLASGGVLDPACGDGVFLEHARARGWGPLSGVDIDGDVIGGPRGATLRVADALEAELGRHALVVGNPPYGRAVGAFVRRMLDGVAPDGALGVLLPESFFVSRRDGEHRRALLAEARLVSVTSVYGRDFLRTGTRARTAFSVWWRRFGDPGSDPPVLLRQPRGEADHELVATAGSGAFTRRVPVADLLDSGRWDPRYHDPSWEDPLRRCVLPVQPLGDFVDDLVYGALGRGERPTPHEGPGGLLYVGQKTITERGVDPERCPRIVDARPFVQDRYRLCPGDLVVPRSGMGTLGKNLLTRWDGVPDGCDAEGAVVDCFDDRLALRGISSAWVLGVLRSEVGWSQIRRVIGGVATPNLSFRQIRALAMPVPPQSVQDAAEDAWRSIRNGDAPFQVLRDLVNGASFDGR